MKLSKYRFVIRPIKELILPPYKGSTLRGGFGHIFKHSLCTNSVQDCEKCMTRHNCVYSYVFETSIPGNKNGMEVSKDKDLPHPFIIEPTPDKRQYFGSNDTLYFDLILICRGVDYFPYFIFAFEELGRMGIGKNNGKYTLEKVAYFDKGNEKVIYDGRSHFRNDYQVIDSEDLVNEKSRFNDDKITIRFLTPTRIKYNGKLVIDIDFQIMMRNLLRRLSMLAQIHCDEKWDLDWKEVIRKAGEVRTVSSDLRWHDWERYSQRQGARMKMGGFLGEISFEGDLADHMFFIRLGEYLHLGKGTAYGLGKYEIIPG